MSSSRKSDELSVDLVDTVCHSMTLKVYGNLFTLFLSFRLIYFIKTLAHQNMEYTVGCKDRNQLTRDIFGVPKIQCKY